MRDGYIYLIVLGHIYLSHVHSGIDTA